MRAEHAVADTSRLELPADLVAELERRGPPPRDDMQVEGWKPSLFTRLIERLIGARGR